MDVVVKETKRGRGEGQEWAIKTGSGMVLFSSEISRPVVGVGVVFVVVVVVR